MLLGRDFMGSQAEVESEDQIQEQAQLLAVYHPVGSMRVPDWVKMDVYVYMERYVYLNTGQ
jgi:hypothetical protein